MRKNLRFLLLTLLCTVVTSAWSADTWVKTDATSLTTGDIVVIVDLSTGRAMSNDNGTSAAPSAVGVHKNDDGTEITSPDGNLQWEVTVGSNTDGVRTYQFKVAGTNNYLYCTNTNNGVRVGTNTNNKFTFEEVAGIGKKYLIHPTTATVSRYIGVYQAQDWRCYDNVNANIRDTETAFFKKVTSQGAVDPSDYITISGTTMEVGGTVTISKPGDLAVTYSSNKTNVATVSKGVVTGVSAGEATITVSWAAVTNQYVAGTKTFTVTVTAASAPIKFVKLAAANMIAADRDFILVAEDNNVAMGTQDNTNYRTPVGVTISNDNAISIKESELANYAVLNLSNVNGGWKIKASDGKYLKASGSGNYLNAVEENEAGIWTITDDFQLQSGNYYIRYNSGSPRFSCYTSGQRQAVLYIKDGYEPISTLQASAEISSTELTVGGSTATITTAPADLVVTYSSSDENVATVSEGVVTAVAAGTATITVSWDEQTIGEDTYASGIQTFTINVTSNQPTTSKTYQKVTSTADLTTGNYLIVNEESSVAFDGSSTSFDNANNVKSVIINNNTITTDEDIFFTIDVDAKTINSASEFYIGVSGYSNGLDYLNSNVNDPFIHNSFEIDENGNAVIGLTIPNKGVMSLKYNKADNQNRFRYYKSGQQPIQLYKEVTEELESVTITISADATDGKDCFATLSALGEGYFTVPADLEVSTLIVNESGKFEYPKNFAEGDAIPGDGAYLLRGAAGEYTFTPTSTPAEPVELGLNMLMSTGEGDITVSAPEGELDSDYYFYKLALNSKRTPGSVGFYWGVTGGGTFRYGKAKQCYLAVPQTYVKLGTSAILFDETNGIENVTTENRNNETYTLTGIRISGDRLPSGIYIVNGKKQVVR